MLAFKNFRTYFLRGMAALLPTILTIWIFFQCYIFIQDNIGKPINKGIVRIIVATTDWPVVLEEQKRSYAPKLYQELQGQPGLIDVKIQDEEVVRKIRIAVGEEFWVTGKGQVTGFLVAIVGVCFIGAFLASVVGRTLWRIIENMLGNIPLISKVYPYIKQITDFVFTKKKMAFNQVVAIQYPRKGVWSVALVTGIGLKKVINTVEKEVLTVFVPSSPTPFTGYVIMAPKDETIELDMTVEEAMRFTISGGVITPSEHAAFEAMVNKEKENNV